jgi:hypothetical protein
LNRGKTALGGGLEKDVRTVKVGPNETTIEADGMKLATGIASNVKLNDALT